MADVYRRIKFSDTWHSCSNCSNWPKAYFDESKTLPADGKLCDECKAKESASVSK